MTKRTRVEVIDLRPSSVLALTRHQMARMAHYRAQEALAEGIALSLVGVALLADWSLLIPTIVVLWFAALSLARWRSHRRIADDCRRQLL